MEKERLYSAISFVFPLIIYIVSLRGLKTGHGNSIIATQYSLWLHDSITIGVAGHPFTNTVDKILYNGVYYSPFAPGFTFISYPFSVIGFLLDGVPSISGNAILMDELFLAISASIAAFLVYKICRFYAGAAESLLASFTLAFATIAWSFTTVVFSHDATMLFCLLAAYFVIKFSRDSQKIQYIVFAGLSLGAASFTEYLATLLIIPFLLYLVFSFRAKGLGVLRVKWKLLVFLIGSAVGPVLDLGYNYLIFGDPLTFPEQYWKNHASLVSQFTIGSLAVNSIYNLISPYRGLFLFSPVLVLGIYGMYRMGRSSPQNRIDTYFLLLLFLFVLLPYSAWSDWTGGASFGPRFIIYGMPFLVIPIAYLLFEKKTLLVRASFVAFFAVSVFIQEAGAFTSATAASSNSVLTYQPISFSIPRLFNGQLDVWWLETLDLSSATWLIQLFVVISFFAVLYLVSYLVFRGGRFTQAMTPKQQTRILADKQ